MENHPESDPHAHDHTHGGSHDAGHDAEHIAAHVKGYVKIGLVLAIFTGITVWLSYVNFGSQNANIVVAMAVATFKVTLVGLFFMHLKSERWTIYRILLITVVFFIGLFFLTGLAFHDPIRLN